MSIMRFNADGSIKETQGAGTPNPDYVSAPYEEKGFCASEDALEQHVTALEAKLGISIKSEITSRENGLVWYHLKQV